MFYSKTTRGFYDPEINASIPPDAVEISVETHAALLAGQSDGKIITHDEAGNPVLVDPAPEDIRVIPQVVSRFQGRAALLQSGKLQQIQDYIDLPTTDAFVKLAWNEVTEFRRQSPMIAVVTSVLGLSSAELDALFLAASQIEA